MLSSGARAFFLTTLTVSLMGQAVISIRSGVIHYFEGAVYLNDQPLEPRLGRFPNMGNGAELRTAEGRAEVLLTPGVFLRVDRNSAIRMVSNSLADSRIELLTGSAMVESAEPAPGTAVALTYKNWQIRFPQKGVYRVDSAEIDSGMGRVWVRDGQAEVTDAATGQPIAVQRGMDLPLAIALVPEQSFSDPGDALNAWSRGRTDSITADNQIAANIQDPASMPALNGSDPYAGLGDPGQYGFTQFPMLGLAPIGPVTPGAYGAYGTGAYASLYPYQPGFYALYLPGYTYRPLFLGLPTVVRGGPTVYSPLPRTGTAITMPRPVYNYPTAQRPATPIYRPAPGAVVRPAAPVHVSVGHK
jgi:hypothetical protein